MAVIKSSCVLIVLALLVSMSSTKPYTGHLERVERGGPKYCNSDSECETRECQLGGAGFRDRTGYKGRCLVVYNGK